MNSVPGTGSGGCLHRGSGRSSTPRSCQESWHTGLGKEGLGGLVLLPAGWEEAQGQQGHRAPVFFHIFTAHWQS